MDVVLLLGFDLHLALLAAVPVLASEGVGLEEVFERLLHGPGLVYVLVSRGYQRERHHGLEARRDVLAVEAGDLAGELAAEDLLELLRSLVLREVVLDAAEDAERELVGVVLSAWSHAEVDALEVAEQRPRRYRVAAFPVLVVRLQVLPK